MPSVEGERSAVRGDRVPSSDSGVSDLKEIDPEVGNRALGINEAYSGGGLCPSEVDHGWAILLCENQLPMSAPENGGSDLPFRSTTV